MKAEADRFFLLGINQLVGHGWPYSPPGIKEPGWRFYAAGAFNAHNPWWIAMPDVAAYLQRVSWILRQGQPVNDVAVFLPEDDAWAEFSPGKASLTDLLPRWVTPELTQAIEDAGYNFDYIDSAAIAARGIHYPVLVLPNVDRISPETLLSIATYVRQGGNVIALGQLPSHGPGLLNFAETSARVTAAAHALFDNASASASDIADATQLAGALQHATPPDLHLTTPATAVGFLHRHLADADVYFVANTGVHPVHTTAHFRATHPSAEWLDADTGKATAVKIESDGNVALDLDAYQSRILLLHDGAPLSKPGGQAEVSRQIADLSHGWQVDFAGNGLTREMPELISWTQYPETLYYSGVAIYRKIVELEPNELKTGPLVLSFGKGTPTADVPAPLGMRAMLDAPIRDAAVVMVNGKRAGAIWHPPYEIEITSLLKPGANEIEVRVANTAVNILAGESLPDYQLLWARYGKRFAPQDMENLHPQPSGLLGEIQLINRGDDPSTPGPTPQSR
jgi:hypothetical protein